MGRIALGLGFPLAAVSVFLWSFASTRDDLPEWIAVAFDVSREPLAPAPTPVFLAAAAGLIAAGSLSCFSAAFSRSLSARSSRSRAQWGGFILGATTMLAWGAMEIHRGLNDWRDATGPGWGLLVVVLVAFAAMAVAGLLARGQAAWDRSARRRRGKR